MSEIELTQQQPRHFIGIRRQVNVVDLPAFYAEVFPKVMTCVTTKGITPASAPMSVWCHMDMETGIADTHAGVFVAEVVEGEGDITAGTTAGGDVLTATHQGGYDTMGQTWGRVFGRAKELGRAPGAGWEIYVDDPGKTDAAELRTEIFLPLK